ncbi:MAG: bifunctional (p)ppGpp synthetase/guanosine-3',5'-bis(diphosphate) 3'-pyrophosphohydrolase [Ruminococcaceae bacterium]|nr:bifunctional (p)ppGpp synthetase/guanosine-3',5'-bis(diphosphate) 3'-pyrophosphohydrolase [Oscillospiraceae bacterium]
MEQMYQKLADIITGYNQSADLSRVRKAYEFAENLHHNQMRLSGEPYIFHPLSVATILAQMEMDTDTIIAGLLHDTVEDTDCTSDDLIREFGEQVAELVDGVTKLGRIPYSSQEEQQVENLRKMFMAMARDIRVILIKLADRLHNMRTLKSMTEEKQRQKALETMEVFAPLAHRLGISKIKWELEDLSLRYLDPIAYQEIILSINQKRQEREEYLEEIKNTIGKTLSESGVKFHIEGRVKHFYSIYKKMYSQNKTIDQIYDLFAVRVIVDTVGDCYNVLGMVHELYKPMPGRFKDYIAMPKPNLYQSLHSTVIGTKGTPFEVQIRTWEMHRTSEYGVAAHWKYKEGKTSMNHFDEKMSWIRQLMEMQKETPDAEEFMHSLKIDLFSDEVFVFTPKGDVYNLPLGSTPIDFAFAIHSAVGSKMLGAKVSGKIVPLDYNLQNGDIVEIITSSGVHGPSRDWLKIVKTSQAKTKINQWFKKQNRDEDVAKGKEAVEKELRRLELPESKVFVEEIISSILRKFSYKTLDDIYASIGYGGIPLSRVINRIRDEYGKRYVEEVPVISIPEKAEEQKKSVPSGGVVVKGVDNCLIRFAQCCNPIPGDDIMGYITRGRGLSIHRKDCVNIQNALTNANEAGRLLEACWADVQEDSYSAGIVYTAYDRDGILLEIAAMMTQQKVSVKALNAKSNTDDTATLEMTVEIGSRAELDQIMKKLRSMPGTIDVKRAQVKKK